METQDFQAVILKQNSEINGYRVVHVHNLNQTYHLTAQVLLDTYITQECSCMFHNIMSSDQENFEQAYGSFACLMPRSEFEADLYLNVHSGALELIIQYIQTGTMIIGANQNCINDCEFENLVNLANMFTMPKLVTLITSRSEIFKGKFLIR